MARCPACGRSPATATSGLELFGGNLGAEVLYALTLGAVCHAYGVSLSFATLLLVNTAASAFSGLIPTPGGVGAADDRHRGGGGESQRRGGRGDEREQSA